MASTYSLVPHAATQLAPSAARIYPDAHVSHVDKSEHLSQFPTQASHAVLEVGKNPSFHVIQSVAEESVQSLQLLTVHVSATQVIPSNAYPDLHCTHVSLSEFQSRQFVSVHESVHAPATSCLPFQNLHSEPSHRDQSV